MSVAVNLDHGGCVRGVLGALFILVAGWMWSARVETKCCQGAVLNTVQIYQCMRSKSGRALMALEWSTLRMRRLKDARSGNLHGLVADFVWCLEAHRLRQV